MGSMERKLNYVVSPEDGVFVARCLDVEVASDGPTEKEAVANLQEALELYQLARKAPAFRPGMDSAEPAGLLCSR